MNATLTPERLHILQHSLGVDRYGQGRQYRNHYCTAPSCDGWDDCEALVAAGFMVKHDGMEISGGDAIFIVTPAGRDAVAFQSPPPPKLTRSQQRYRDYRTSDCNMTFLEFARWWDAHKKAGVI